MALNAVMYWFNNRRPGSQGPSKAVILLADGVQVPVDFNKAEDRLVAGKTLNQYRGHATFLPAYNHWIAEGSHPMFPDRTLYVQGCPTAEDALKALCQKQEAARAEEEAIRANPALRLEREMASHDWTYAYSDSYGVYRAGESHWQQIVALRSTVPAEVWDALENKYNPFKQVQNPA